jgi:predicted DNA-binding transcriptional regulator YafY
MARGELILRQWNLLKMLQTRGEGMPLRDIAEAFEVSERTVQRDFEVLQELGFPIEYRGGRVRQALLAAAARFLPHRAAGGRHY